MHFLLPIVIIGAIAVFAISTLRRPSPQARRRQLREDLLAIQEEDRRAAELEKGPGF
jgi:type II secretory pathway pseudopilin PulG